MATLTMDHDRVLEQAQWEEDGVARARLRGTTVPRGAVIAAAALLRRGTVGGTHQVAPTCTARITPSQVIFEFDA